MPEETSIADLIQSLGTTPQKLEEEFDVTRVVRWAFPVCGLVFAGMAGDIAYELKQKPPQPTQIQPAQEAYSRISYNRGSIDDVKILYEGVIAAKNATGDHLNPFEINLGTQLRTEDLNTRKSLANYFHQELDSYSWSNGGNLYGLMFFFGIIGAVCFGAGYEAHRTARRDGAILTLLEREKTSKPEQTFH